MSKTCIFMLLRSRCRQNSKMASFLCCYAACLAWMGLSIRSNSPWLIDYVISTVPILNVLLRRSSVIFFSEHRSSVRLVGIFGLAGPGTHQEGPAFLGRAQVGVIPRPPLPSLSSTRSQASPGSAATGGAAVADLPVPSPDAARPTPDPGRVPAPFMTFRSTP
jgi:hypothetical protein